MFSRKRHFAILSLIALLVGLGLVWLVFFQGDDDEPALSQDQGPTAALSGRVLDSAGRPLVGAYVFAGSAATRSGTGGRFAFQELPAEEIPIDVTAEGYRRAGFEGLGRPLVDLSDGEPLHDLELYLPRAASASGRVVAGGRPVADAEVSLSYLFAEGLDGTELDPFIVSEVARTDTSGRFAIAEMAPGRLQFLVDAPGHDFAESEEIYFRPGHERTDIRIDIAPAGVIYGSVVDPDGRAIEADLTVEPHNPDQPSTRTTTTRDGLFLISELPEGTYRLIAEASGLRPHTVDNLEVTANDITEVEVRLQASQGLFGQVVEHDGSPVAGAWVHLVTQTGDERRRLTTDAQGRFQWSDPPDGRWTAQAISPTHASTQVVSISADTERVLQLEPGAMIYGRVVDGRGQPVENFTLGVASAELDAAPELRVHTRNLPRINGPFEDGVFEYGPVTTGRMRLIATSQDHAPGTTELIELTSNSRSGPHQITLEQGSTVQGVVRDLETGDPVRGIQVTFLLSRPDGRSPRATTDSQGYYELQGIPSGRGTLRADHDLYITELFGGIDVPVDGALTYDLDVEPIGDGPPGQALQGIGASLMPADTGFEVVRVNDGSPAARAGIRSGDIVRQIDGRAARQMTVDQAVEYIRGEPGTTVRLGVHRSGRGTRNIDVERDRIFFAQDRQVRGRDYD